MPTMGTKTKTKEESFFIYQTHMPWKGHTWALHASIPRTSAAFTAQGSQCTPTNERPQPTAASRCCLFQFSRCRHSSIKGYLSHISSAKKSRNQREPRLLSQRYGCPQSTSPQRRGRLGPRVPASDRTTRKNKMHENRLIRLIKPKSPPPLHSGTPSTQQKTKGTLLLPPPSPPQSSPPQDSLP